MTNPATQPAALPEPTRGRWQPQRLGLTELYHYDQQEFRFRDGRLLLRGNNGTGKSKVLSLTLPLLLDANLSAARVEPDGDRAKKMEWNLLMGKRHERRIGYTWIEFARLTDAGAEYVTLGCGLKAAAGKPGVTRWLFITDRRMGKDLGLIGPDGRALAREQLIAALGERGRVYDAARDYRRAVDERLFRLGETRYRALMDTLIQLRQPQLSKQPNEQALSAALTEALAPLDRRLLEDVADAMNQLEEYRNELTDHEAMLEAVATFHECYKRYASVFARRRARRLRQAQSAHEKASREVNEADRALAEAAASVDNQNRELTSLASRLDRSNAALGVLRDSPAMRDAEALNRARRTASRLAEDAAQTKRDTAQAQSTHDSEAESSRERAGAADNTRTRLETAFQKTRQKAETAGIQTAFERPFADIESPDGIERVADDVIARIGKQLQAALDRRREQIQRVTELLGEADEANRTREHRRDEHRQRQADSEQLAEQVTVDTEAARQAGDALTAAWQKAMADARQLEFNDSEALDALHQWIEVGEDDNPMATPAARAENAAREALARRASALDQRGRILAAERDELTTERDRLTAGVDREPPAPHTREEGVRANRPGAPLWRLIDFEPRVEPEERAGLEAALQAAGLLDAWVLPEGELLDPATQDTLLSPGPAATEPLVEWLRPAIDPGDENAAKISEATLDTLLASVACGANDDNSRAGWVAPDGRFRLGALRGAWHKPDADYIGAGAREAARRRRLTEIDAALGGIDRARQTLDAEQAALDTDRDALQNEIDALPNDLAVREAHIQLATRERQHRATLDRVAEARERLQTAETQWTQARERLERDAADLALPATDKELRNIGTIVQDCARDVDALRHALVDHRRALAEWRRQTEREARARDTLESHRERHKSKTRDANRAASECDTLWDTVGADALAVQDKVARVETAVRQLETDQRNAQTRLGTLSEARGTATGRLQNRREALEQASQQRVAAVDRLNAFARTGLLAIAVPDTDIAANGWSVDPALQAARKTEQALNAVAADDETWQRVQTSLGHDFGALQQVLAARGHRVTGEPGEHGFIVRVVMDNRPERPDRLVERLRTHIRERRELLSAREREILENHLQAEIATELQRLIQSAERRVAAMNAELGRRPTSTGVKFRLDWQPKPESDGGAPTGLTEARQRLLRTVSDAWSAEDRQVVGRFLQNCIDAERARDDAATTLQALTTALDYRAWHQFRVKRWQDGSWRALSGPASSGERALGLTVPLFAAASSHYGSAATEAPRLVLLDEAFAGIDDTARAGCMGLMHEFDLDVVMTSEREWGCYKEVPGLAICQLARREGIDAVFVSPWSWDGRTRRREADPTRRAPAAVESGE